MKNLLLFLSLIILCSCNSDDDNESFTLENRSYRVVAFEVESNMDLNGDGVFSTDLLSELTPDRSVLLRMIMKFLPDGTAYYPWYDWPDFNVVNGQQTSWTGALSSAPLPYRLSESNIIFDNGFILLNGELSDNSQTIVTSYDPNVLYEYGPLNFIGNFMNQSGEVEAYSGDFILTLELIE